MKIISIAGTSLESPEQVDEDCKSNIRQVRCDHVDGVEQQQRGEDRKWVFEVEIITTKMSMFSQRQNYPERKWPTKNLSSIRLFILPASACDACDFPFL